MAPVNYTPLCLLSKLSRIVLSSYEYLQQYLSDIRVFFQLRGSHFDWNFSAIFLLIKIRNTFSHVSVTNALFWVRIAGTFCTIKFFRIMKTNVPLFVRWASYFLTSSLYLFLFLLHFIELDLYILWMRYRTLHCYLSASLSLSLFLSPHLSLSPYPLILS